MSKSTDAKAHVAVLGVGYVGLPTAVYLASFGHHVHCSDSDGAKIAKLLRGETPIREDGLQELLVQGIAAGLLRFTTSNTDVVAGAGIVILCLPTPQGPDGSADVSFLENAVMEIAEHLVPDAIVVIKSTVPMGEAEAVEKLVKRSDVKVVSNPEFLREGFAVYDSFNPERIVVGAKDSRAAERVGQLFCSTSAPLVLTDNVTAETIKYVSNAFLAAKLSFVNQVTNFCDAVGADSEDVLRGMALDRRIGAGHMRPSPGWGGPCLQKDSLALLTLGTNSGFDFTMVRAAIEANEAQMNLVVEKVQDSVVGPIDRCVVAVWGLTFKAETNDLRNSPSIDIARRLVAQGAKVQAYDPAVQVGQSGLPDGVELFDDQYAACAHAQVLVVLTEWEEFRTANFEKVALKLEGLAIVDGRNILDPSVLRDLNFKYVGLGRR
ncbi:MAG TPA: UDP-glucose/GDP-mannose dehydrogenase family protein [Acidimicrobiales bacterium]|nr:UDP-glucose/GDP-mannose dehydrogenase family protein [Acidimicrobiales bacterium]